VFADKARYYISKSGDQIDADTEERHMSRRDSSASIPTADETMAFSVKAESIASPSTDYIPPSELDLQLDTDNALTVKLTRFESKDGTSLSLAPLILRYLQHLISNLLLFKPILYSCIF
jgi:hypothetical protein